MVVLDANILLEIVERRQRTGAVLRAIEHLGSSGHTLHVSSLTVSNVFYLAEAHKIDISEVEEEVRRCQVFGVLASDVDWALKHYNGKDFEDAVQIAAALREKCTAFLTLDTRLAKKYGKLLNIELIR